MVILRRCFVGDIKANVKNANAGLAGRVGRAGPVEPVRRAGTVGRAGLEACDLNHCFFSLNKQTSDDLVIA